MPPPLAALELPAEVGLPLADPDRSWAEQPEPSAEAPVAPDVLRQLVPAGLRGRWDPGRRGVAALALVAALAAVLAGVVLLRGRPQAISAPTASVVSPGPDAGGVVVVDVAGKVRHPGVVQLPLGSRVDDAVRAAGGPLPGASYDGLNRARKLTDGEQVLVGVPAAAGSAPGGASADSRVDLNLADVSALDGLPGIGPVLAQKIVDWRTEHGRFASVDQLREVSGIGESKFTALKNKVRT